MDSKESLPIALAQINLIQGQEVMLTQQFC